MVQRDKPQPDVDGEDAVLLAQLREAFSSCDYRLDGASLSALGVLESGGGSGSARIVMTTLVPGSRLDDFEIIEEIGHGGMGVVYRARQVSLDREVALKVLPVGARTRGRESARRRFRTEAQAVARLNHPNVVPVFAHGEHDDRLYFAMELVDGISLDAAIRSQPELLSSTFARTGSGPYLGTNERRMSPPGKEGSPGAPGSSSALSTPRASDSAVQTANDATTPLHRTLEDFRYLAGLIADVADGLSHAHEQGVIHRDIKPQNLLLSSDGRLRIMDFGLAQLTDQPGLTVTGEIMGTPAYLPPEQVRGGARRVDHRADIYSLGVTLYELLTWQRPFDGDTRDQILNRICTQEPTQPRRLDSRIPLDLETICLRAIEKEPDHRFASAAALADDLNRFAEGRPILSRPIGPGGRALKWMRRRKALTLAAVAASVAILLAGTLLGTMASARRTEANDVLRDAYEQLAYRDYRSPERVLDDIEWAAERGADELDVHLTMALASLGVTNQADAVQHLEAALELAPDHKQALYMLAWAQWRDHDQLGSRSTFNRAEDLGGPETPIGWFLRGLAVHFDHPDVAVDSYYRANTLEARDGGFYPQAGLHHARAYNQQLYATRELDALSDAVDILERLIEDKHYGGYPYYLLSIAYRLAGEVLGTMQTEDGEAQSAEYYAQALSWARLGQVEYAEDDRPVVAEAECLERLGRYDEAIEARTRAIRLRRTSDRGRCESYHYRWRLAYWTGDYEAALGDIEAHAECMPDSRYYAHAYRALVYAEMDEMETALNDARAVAEESPDDAQAALVSASCLRLLGRADEADELLTDRADRVRYDDDPASPHPPAWQAALYEFASRQRSLDDLAERFGEPDLSRKSRAAVHYHAGAMALAEGDRKDAAYHFTVARDAHDSELGYTFHATIILEKLQSDPNWPAWIPVQTTTAAGTTSTEEVEGIDDDV